MRRVVGRFVLFSGVLLFPAAAAAQDATLQGRVADSTGVPVAQATVVLEPGGWRTLTDDQGRYTIGRIPPAAYTVQVRRIGFAAEPRTIVVRAGETTQLNVTMRQLPSALAAVQVMVGSRARHTAADELAVPVDVFPADMIRSQGTTETAQILAQLSPSVNFPRQSVSDASEIVRPFTMRGLSPDHTLVLINGKRRHRTALIHYYGAGQGAGSSGVDMNAIPSGAVERLEVLRDGAAAQYGSDAIAGVVNLVLKQGAFAPFVTASYGQYMTGEENPADLSDANGERDSFDPDGETLNVNAGWGFRLAPGATLGLFAEYRDREPTNRAGPDPTDMFTAGDADVVTDGKLVTKNNTIPMPNHHWGDGASRDLMTYATAQAELGTGAAAWYAHGGYSAREGTGFGYFRPPISERNWREIYPNGFLPKFAPDVTDVSAVTGIRGALATWATDLSVSYGSNAFVYTLENTLNTSLGPCLATPCAPGQDGVAGNADDPGIPNQTSFNAGELGLSELIASLETSRGFVWREGAPIHLAFGVAFRRETYEITAGETASWINGGHLTQDSTLAPTGSQVFPGFRPEDAVDADRTNVGVYADLEGDIAPRLLGNVAARFENYSDFGSKLTGKLALRYQPTERFTVRGAVSTGFRAPSLNQSHYSSVVTNFKTDPLTGNPVPFEVGIFPVASAEARALGARDLDAESSLNLSAGFAVSPSDNFTITADVYRISVDDRVVLTGFLDTDSVASILRNIGSRAEAAQYFTNAIDTRTTGFDLTADLRAALAGGTFGLMAAFNATDTKIPNENDIPLPPELEGTGEELLGKYDEGGLLAITDERPKWRSTLTTQYRRGVWSGLARYSYYGKYRSALYGYCEACVQEYGARGIVDVELGWSPRPAFKLSVGARNLFDVYPDKMRPENGFDIFPYPPASPFGYNGRFVYTQAEWSAR